MIISGKVGLKKPDAKIYELAIKKFVCDPKTTLLLMTDQKILSQQKK